MKQWKRTLGFTAWGIAIVGWVQPLVIPFTSLPIETKVVVITVSVIIAEICFILGGVFLGAQYKDRVKEWFKSRLNATSRKIK